jgi:magnesium chelatase subunit D
VSAEAEVRFPFSAVVGHDELKLALVLNTVDPSIGGVLLRGQKGSAKSTLARALAGLLPGDAAFVELPLGASEDRVVGSIDLRAALTTGERRLEPGLLAAAHGGVLYVDEVNLLADHLVDVLLDAAASGVNRVERDGISASHPARFVLVGSMNPEEGELRPQLLDRFGLAVEVATSPDPKLRATAVERRLDFESDPVAFGRTWAAEEDALRRRLHALALAGAASTPRPSSEVVRVVGALCAEAGAEGLRADLVICRAASALAAWEGADSVSVDHVRRVAALALSHRRRRSPFEEAGMDRAELDRALGSALEQLDREEEEDVAGARPAGEGEGDEEARTEGSKGSGRGPAVPGQPGPDRPRLGEGPVAAGHEPASGRGGRSEGRRGRVIGARPGGEAPDAVAVVPTVTASVLRRGQAAAAGEAAPALSAEDLRQAVHEQRVASLVVFVVDASGSMGAPRRMEAAKGAVLGLLLDAYQRRDRVALVVFGGDGARVVLRPTGSVEVARARLEDLATGGRTPLAAGIEAGLGLLDAARPGAHAPLLVLVSDGRATDAPGGADPLEAAMEAARVVRRRGVAALVVDAEEGPGRLGLARDVAEAMGARYLGGDGLSAAGLAESVRAYLPGGPSGRKIEVMRSDTTGSPSRSDHSVS